MKRLIVLTILLGACSNETEPNPWARTFEQDLQFIYDTIQDSHPGPVDELNPGFANWLEDGVLTGVVVDNDDSYVYGLLEYIGGFRDGHLAIRFNIERDTRLWPGFLSAWRDENLVVYESTNGQPPAGALIESCDGVDIETLIQDRYFRFRGNPEIPSHWTRAGPRIFIDLGNPLVARPSECTFIVDGEPHTSPLHWREFSWDDLTDTYMLAAARPRPEAAYSVLADDIAWFSAPTFGPNETEVEIYNRAIDELLTITNPETLIVIDLRGNGGGASMWANRIALAIWGYEEPPEDEGYVEWRPSAGNIEYWETVPAYLEDQFGENDPSLDWAAQILAGMRDARQAGQALWRQPEIDVGEALQETGKHRKEPFAGHVVVVTDSQCASACLDGMDVFHDRERLTHVGGTTSADTQYMEIRSVSVPSGHATLSIPMKVYRGRDRPEGGYYEPEIPYTGMHWTDDAIKAWVRSLWRDGALSGDQAEQM